MILVDTHVVLWLALEPARISRKAAAVIEETRHTGQGLAISDMTLLEIAVIESKRRIPAERQPGNVPDRGGVEVCCPSDHRPDLCTSDGPSSRLSQRSGRPHHRSHCIGRGDFVSHRGQRYPEIQSAAHHLVSGKPTRSNQTIASPLSSIAGTSRRASASSRLGFQVWPTDQRARRSSVFL